MFLFLDSVKFQLRVTLALSPQKFQPLRCSCQKLPHLAEGLALKFQEGWFPLLLFEPPSTWEKSNPAERRKKERKKRHLVL